MTKKPIISRDKKSKRTLNIFIILLLIFSIIFTSIFAVYLPLKNNSNSGGNITEVPEGPDEPFRPTDPINPNEVPIVRPTDPINPNEVPVLKPTDPINPNEVPIVKPTDPTNPNEVHVVKPTDPIKPEPIDVLPPIYTLNPLPLIVYWPEVDNKQSNMFNKAIYGYNGEYDINRIKVIFDEWIYYEMNNDNYYFEYFDLRTTALANGKTVEIYCEINSLIYFDNSYHIPSDNDRTYYFRLNENKV